MEAQFFCNRCRALLSIPVADLGKRVLCPACDATYLVVADSPPSPTPAEPVRRTEARERSPRPKPNNDRRPKEQPAAPVLSGCGPLLAFAGIFVALTVLIIVGSRHRAAVREWFPFEGDKFAIEFPRNPVEAAPQPLAEGHVRTQAVRYHQRTFAISHIDIRNAQPDQADKWLDWAEENLVPAQVPNGRIKQSREIRLGQRQGRELLVEVPNATMISRLYYVDGRLYHLSVDNIIQGPDQSLERFFRSFKLE